MWERRSGWRAEGDSIRAYVFTGLVGWSLVLREQAASEREFKVQLRTGRADYLSDVVVNGREYSVTYAVTAKRVACPHGFDVNAIVRPGWHPDKSPLYFETQVDTPAAMAPKSVRPALDAAQRQAGVRGSVLAQFVLDLHGRPDSATIKILRSSGSVATRAVERALPRMRYRPAMLKGRPVAQLVQQQFDFE